jgi:predicted ArsR family transcriptional regulator
MLNARQKILNYILEQKSVTVEELSKVFKVTPSNIRHHLSILIEQGSVTILGSKAAEHKGRPAQIYTCTKANNENNLAALAGALLSIVQNNNGQNDNGRILKIVADQMAANLPVDKHNPTRQLYSAIRMLNRMNYQAHWEAHVENPRIMLGHCPYKALLDHHPEMCRVDEYVLEALLDAPVEQIDKLTHDARGLSQCVFSMQNQGVGK